MNGDLFFFIVERLWADIDLVALADGDGQEGLVGGELFGRIEEFVAIEVVHAEGGQVIAQIGVDAFFIAIVGVDQLDLHDERGLMLGACITDLCEIGVEMGDEMGEGSGRKGIGL